LVNKAPSYKSYRSSSKKASFTASKIKSSNTKAERLLRSSLWKAGLRFFKNVKALPGKPDVVFPRLKIVVFCDGDFWHGKNWDARKQRLNKGSNSKYWVAKIEANMQRDRRYDNELKEQGWQVLRFWESDIFADPQAIASEVVQVVRLRKRLV
jgi:DNA mismatch endonuclease (patch repair protein)